MAIRLKVQEDKVTLKVGQGEGATLNAVREARPILVNDYDDLINKPSINGVELEGNLTTEDLHIQAGVLSVNGQTGDVTLDAADVGALPDDTVIPVDSNLVHKTGTETITGSKSFTNGVEISRPTSGAILKLSSAAADTNFILERTNGSQCVLESGGSLGLFGTKSNHPLQIRTNYVNRMTVGTDGSVKLATAPATSSNDTQVATTKWVNDKGYAQASAIPTQTSDLTNDSGYVDATQAANAAPVQSVNGQTGAVVLDASDVNALPDNTAYVGSVNVTQNLSSGTKIGSISVDGTSTDLYAPTDTDTKVTQTATTTTDYTYWRGLCIGNSAVSAEGTGFSTVTDQVRTFNNLRVQPSTGTIKANIFKGDLTGNVTGTASGNLKSGDNVSALTNDANYITSAGAPVQSVNGDTGTVVLDATDVGALPDTTRYAASNAVGGSATFANGIHYGRVDNTSTSTVFTATIPGITEYYDGLTIILYNGKVTSASGYTININGLGAYGTYSNMAVGNENTPTAPTRDTTIFNANYAMIFIYCSDIGGQGVTGWICYRGYDANTNTIGYQLRTNSSTMPAADKFYRYRILFTSADGHKWVPSTTSTSTNATAKRDVNQRPIDPFGEIVYYGTTTAIEANANVTAAQLWQQYNMTLGYAFNRTGAALVLPYPSPIYIKCAPQSDGSAIIDADNPYVLTLPSAADGKIYIYLGRTYSATAIEMTMKHPVYYIDANARKRMWTGEDISNLV